jgi:putative mycofactocin binding protein MftB
MVGHLAKNVQVRKENWGLLFYSQTQDRVCFVRSGDWLYPQHFNGTWTFDGLVNDITCRIGTSAEVIERSIQKLTKSLMDSGMIVNEPY